MFPLSKIELESGCIFLARLRLIDNQPLFYDVTYIPNINMPRFTSRTFENRSLFDTLRKFYQIDVTGGEQKLKAIPASEKISQYLQVQPGHPILHLERKINTSRPGFSFYSSLYCNTSEHALYGIFQFLDIHFHHSRTLLLNKRNSPSCMSHVLPDQNRSKTTEIYARANTVYLERSIVLWIIYSQSVILFNNQPTMAFYTI